jgi:hypothetical protein
MKTNQYVPNKDGSGPFVRPLGRNDLLETKYWTFEDFSLMLR